MLIFIVLSVTLNSSLDIDTDTESSRILYNGWRNQKLFKKVFLKSPTVLLGFTVDTSSHRRVQNPAPVPRLSTPKLSAASPFSALSKLLCRKKSRHRILKLKCFGQVKAPLSHGKLTLETAFSKSADVFIATWQAGQRRGGAPRLPLRDPSFPRTMPPTPAHRHGSGHFNLAPVPGPICSQAFTRPVNLEHFMKGFIFPVNIQRELKPSVAFNNAGTGLITGSCTSCCPWFQCRLHF